MKRETLEKAKVMLAMVLGDGATFVAAGEAFDVGRSTAERTVKKLLNAVARDVEIPGMDGEMPMSLQRLRQVKAEVLAAVAAWEPSSSVRNFVLTADELAAGVARVRSRSENANRDVALVFVLLSTGAKPIEIARLQVRDYLNADGSVRANSEFREAVTTNGKSRPLHFTSARVCEAIDSYLTERRRRGIGTESPLAYRGLDPESGLFLTESGRSFEITPRSATDKRLTCRLMISTFRTIFVRAGWPGFTAQAARQNVARGLSGRGADADQVGRLLGLTSQRAVKRLLQGTRPPLEVLTRDLV